MKCRQGKIDGQNKWLWDTEKDRRGNKPDVDDKDEEITLDGPYTTYELSVKEDRVGKNRKNGK